MFLKQYRGKNWPVLDSFAVGLLKESPGEWAIETHSTDTLRDVTITTPLGGWYLWYRNW